MKNIYSLGYQRTANALIQTCIEHEMFEIMTTIVYFEHYHA